MPTEQEELRLTVSLVKNAAVGIVAPDAIHFGRTIESFAQLPLQRGGLPAPAGGCLIF
jgi:hypothetical protein